MRQNGIKIINSDIENISLCINQTNKTMRFLFVLWTVLTLTVSSSFAQDSKPNYTLEDIWQRYSFYPRTVYGIRSMNDGEHYTTLENNKIKQYKYKDGKLVKVLFDFSQLKDITAFNIDDYSFNNDETKILFSAETERIYRHSFRAKFYLFDIKNNTLELLSKDGKQQLMSFSPDGQKMAFVRHNNLYYIDLKTKTEIAVTTDGEKNKIINGAPDWVYEEEFSFSKAYEWSPNSQSIAFMRFDESRVKEYNMPIYNSLYPEQYVFKYPKAGEENSKVSVHIYNLETKKIQNVDLGTAYEYIPRIQWTKDANTLSIQRLNRLQNHFEILFADAKTGSSKVIYSDKNDTYIEIYDNLTFTDDGKYFIFSNETSGYNHLYLYDINGKLQHQITKGDWEVTNFKGYNPKNKKLYFISTENSPSERMLYEIKLDGSSKKQLSKNEGVNSVEFSKGFKYYINTWSSANNPYVVSLHSGSGKEIRELKNNKQMFELLQKYNWSPKEFLTVKNSEGTELNAWIIKPANFDASKKYPVYMTVYGGPGQQTVMNQWDYNALWHNYLAQKGYIVFSVDNRGTDGRGYKFRRATYGQMGKLESKDQADVAKYLQSLDYVDANRIGIQGWSYGGYMSTLCLEKYPDIFKMAIAVAPVTNWRYYDSVYSERYLGLPQDNAKGYDANSPTNPELVKQLKGNFLLIHGSADDNVHLQNSMELSKLLIESNFDYEQFIYPNKNHGIYGGNTRLHLFNKLTKFTLENL